MEHSVIGYFTSWSIYGRRYYPRDIPGAGVTHLNYAFAMPTVEGTCDPVDPWADFQRPFPAQESVDSQADNPDDPNQRLFGNFNQLRKLKAAHPHLKLLISIGGWTRSAYFWHAAATPQSRTAFVRSCIDTFIKGNLPSGDWPPQAGGPGAAAGLFDGIDIDWMHPGADRGDGARYSSADRLKVTLLFQEFRGQLDALDRAYLLSAVLPGGRLRSTGSFQLAQVAQSLDWVNLLTYDFHGDWDQRTNFNSPFLAAPNDPTPSLDRATWNVSGTVDWYLASGVPAHKLVVGIPFYVR